MSDTGWTEGFSLGVALFRPDVVECHRVATLLHEDRVEYDEEMSEQGFLNAIYPLTDVHPLAVELPFEVNGLSVCEARIPEFWDQLVPRLRVVHFTPRKPWQCPERPSDHTSCGLAHRWWEALADAEKIAGMSRPSISRPAKISWVGCFTDSVDRDLKGGPSTRGYHTESCRRACEGYRYMALQDRGFCSCGEVYGTGRHMRTSDTECGRVCPGEEGLVPERRCGAIWRNAIYQLHPVPDKDNVRLSGA
eukprot:gnl/TRDRNA2_/TRDRNA2_119280_c0_seq1.p1 gnl/TRDRNA2_/TRDRNA2_119280_c0~~gnl/TRDRNA2_/TRDRNA2_119280_c0_seq1.p1  ORF type:complete len:249 (-),score=24.71 gnl/TRDRNA2_/TRDRNA2_119280_c0_seq1:82-828(-)